MENSNPLLDTREYEVVFTDGHLETFSANIIAESMYAQVDSEGHRHLLIDEIQDHKCDVDVAIPKGKEFVGHSANPKRIKTTAGWSLLVLWKDGSTNWVALKDLKNSCPVQVAEYAVANKIADEPAFAWWVPYTLKKRNQIISKVKSRYWLKTHKFGFELPKDVNHAKRIDEANGNTFWQDAIKDEMGSVRPAFEPYYGNEKDLDGYTPIHCHMIFDIKMGENFRRKARFVAGGHVTQVDSAIAYSSTVSRDSVQLIFTIAALNGLELQSADIKNAYLQADCREKIYTRAGPEFGSEAGTIMIIRKALYGLRSAGGAFWSLLRETLTDMGFKPSYADMDVWLQPAVKKDGTPIYEYVLTYVDDLITAADGERARGILQEVSRDFVLKNDKIEPPQDFLGAQLFNKRIDGNCPEPCWRISSEKYVAEAIKNVQQQRQDRGLPKLTKHKQPLPSKYRPELDLTDELDDRDANYFQELIGVLRWAIELGRVDIAVEVSMLSSYLALPRQGHLDAAYHIFSYLMYRPKVWLAMDPNPPNINQSLFPKANWAEFYPDAKEELPPKMPEPRGKPVMVECFVDADHASNRLTHCSQTGILLFCNRAPIIWLSKHQNTVESSTFGSEYVAARIAVDMIEAL